MKKYLNKIQTIIFIISLVFLAFPMFAHAQVVLPTPNIHGYVYGSTDSDLAIEITWDGVDNNEYGFKVEKQGVNGKEIAATFEPVDLGDTQTTNGGFYLDEAVVANNQYTYYVTTYDRDDNESVPAQITLSTGACEESAKKFTNFTATASGTTVNLSWNYVCSAVEYNIYRDGNLITHTSGTGYVDMGVPNGNHTYKIEASDTKSVTSSGLVGSAMAAENLTGTVSVFVGGSNKTKPLNPILVIAITIALSALVITPNLFLFGKVRK